MNEKIIDLPKVGTIKKIQIQKCLGIKHTSVIEWEKKGKIPPLRCIQLEPHIGIPARKLYLNPELLLSRFNKDKSESKAIVTQN